MPSSPRADASLQPLVVRLSRSMLPVGLLLVAAGLFDGPVRTVCWILAIGIDVGGLYVQGVEGWRVEAGHLAERFGLIVIIALGESIVSVGLGAEGQPIGRRPDPRRPARHRDRRRVVVGLLRRRGDRRRAPLRPRHRRWSAC